MKAIHFVTGATGFVGSDLVWELLDQPDTEVYAPVRWEEEPSEVRLRSALRHAGRSAGEGSRLDQAISERWSIYLGESWQLLARKEAAEHVLTQRKKRTMNSERP